MMFGLVGVLAQSAVNSHIGKDAVGDIQEDLKFDVAETARNATRAAIDTGRYGQMFTAAAGPGEPVLSVVPYASLTYVTDADVRPYVVLKATLKGQQGGSAWTVRYICCAGQALPLNGAHGLAADNGALLKTVFAQETRDAVNLMLSDLAHPYSRGEDQLISVDANFPFVRKRMSVVGYKLAEDQNSIIFAAKASNALIFSGIEILDKSAIRYAPIPAKGH